MIYLEPSSMNNLDLELRDIQGRIVYTQNNIQPAITYTVDLNLVESGMYLVIIKGAEKEIIRKLVKS
jgi:hypothetical protein